MRDVKHLCSLAVVILIAASRSAIAGPSSYQVKVDPKALGVARNSFIAMGGDQAIAGYQDSVSTGTITIYSGEAPISYPITIKSKGLRETRVELQKPNGVNLRIVNHGEGAIVRPDGSVKMLDSNNTFHEHVNHIPVLSVLAEHANGNVDLAYKGLSQLASKSQDVVEIGFVPNSVNGATFSSMSATQFFVDQATQLVDRIRRSSFYEGRLQSYLYRGDNFF